MNDKTEIRFRARYRDFREGFVHGVGWSFGVSIGFVLVSTLLVVVFNTLGGLPLAGITSHSLGCCTAVDVSL